METKKIRKQILIIAIHLIIAIVFFSISHESNELPMLGAFTLGVYVIFYFPIIYKLIKKLKWKNYYLQFY